MSPEENKALVTRFVEAVFNRGKLDLLPTFVAIDAVEHYPHIPHMRDLHGIEGLKQEYAALLMAFPDFHITIDHMIADAGGDTVAWRWTLTGTHKGMYREFAPTKRTVAVRSASFERIAGDKIMERWANIPECEILRQIGAYDR
ncbi:MAG: ester cyclase [Halobacteriota archaeon]